MRPYTAFLAPTHFRYRLGFSCLRAEFLRNDERQLDPVAGCSYSSAMLHPLVSTRGQVTQIQDSYRTLANILLITIKATQIKVRAIATMINPLRRPAPVTLRHPPATMPQCPLSQTVTLIPTTPMDISTGIMGIPMASA